MMGRQFLRRNSLLEVGEDDGDVGSDDDYDDDDDYCYDDNDDDSIVAQLVGSKISLLHSKL